jgi:hypothetical protein
VILFQFVLKIDKIDKIECDLNRPPASKPDSLNMPFSVFYAELCKKTLIRLISSSTICHKLRELMAKVILLILLKCRQVWTNYGLNQALKNRNRLVIS